MRLHASCVAAASAETAAFEASSVSGPDDPETRDPGSDRSTRAASAGSASASASGASRRGSTRASARDRVTAGAHVPQRARQGRERDQERVRGLGRVGGIAPARRARGAQQLGGDGDGGPRRRERGSLGRILRVGHDVLHRRSSGGAVAGRAGGLEPRARRRHVVGGERASTRASRTSVASRNSSENARDRRGSKASCRDRFRRALLRGSRAPRAPRCGLGRRDGVEEGDERNLVR